MPSYYDTNLIVTAVDSNPGTIGSNGNAALALNDYEATGAFVDNTNAIFDDNFVNGQDSYIYFDMALSEGWNGTDSLTRLVIDYVWTTNQVDDAVELYLAIMPDATTTGPAYVSETTLYATTAFTASNESSTASLSMTAAGQSATPAQWATCKVQLRFYYGRNMGGDGNPFGMLKALYFRFTDALATPPAPGAAEISFDGGSVGYDTFPIIQFDIAAKAKAASVSMEGLLPDVTTPFVQVYPAAAAIVFGGLPTSIPHTSPGAAAVSVDGELPVVAVGPAAYPGAAEISFAGAVPTYASDVIPIRDAPYCRNEWLEGATTGVERPTTFYHLTTQRRLLWDTADTKSSPGVSATVAKKSVYGYDVVTYNRDLALDIWTAGATNSPVQAYQITNYRDSSPAGTLVGWEGHAHYFSQNNHHHGTYVGAAYGANSILHHIDGTDTNDFDWASFTITSSNGANVTYNDCGTVPWYDANGNLQDWVGMYYQTTSTEGWLLGLKQGANDLVPSIYKFQGGTSWNAGTDLTGGSEEAVNYDTKIIGWCRASTSDIYKIYVAVTTENASTQAHLNFKLFAVQLDTMSITRVVNDSTNYDNGTWNFAPYGDGSAVWKSWNNGTYGSGTTTDEERCIPVEIGADLLFVVRSNNSSGGEQYTKITLNTGNWLSPTLTSVDANINFTYPPASTVDHGVQRYILHGVVWNPDSDAWNAVMLHIAEGADDPGKLHVHFSHRDILDGAGSFSSWELVNKASVSWADTSRHYHLAMGAVRGWGVNQRSSSDYYKMGFGLVLSATDTSIASYAQNSAYYIRWWEQGDDFTFAESINVGPNSSVTPGIKMEYNPDVSVGPNTSVVITESIASDFILTGDYDIEDGQDNVDEIINVGPNTTVVVAIDTESVWAQVYIGPNSQVSITDEVVQLSVGFLNVSTQYWGQSWTDDLLTLVNADRTTAGLPLFKDLLYVNNQRLLINQNNFDVPQRHALDMGENDLLLATDVSFSDDYETLSLRLDEMNPKSLVESRKVLDSMLIGDSNLDVVTGIQTADYFYNTLTYGTVMSGLWLWDFGGVPDDEELYLQVGFTVKPHPISGKANSGWFSFQATNYEGHPYTGTSGGGGPGDVSPTPVTDTTYLHANNYFTGDEWMREVVEIQNQLRLDNGLAPYLIPDTEFYTRFGQDVEHGHSTNMADTQIINHEDPAFPAGWRLIIERIGLAGYRTANENILAGWANGEWSDALGGLIAWPSYILDDSHIFSPQDVVDGWYASAGHRANMLHDYGPDREVYSVLGWEFRKFTNATITDSYNGTVYNDVDGYWMFITNKFADVTSEMANIYLNITNQIDGAVIEMVGANYDLVTYTKVRGDHDSVYSIRVGAEHEAPYSVRVNAEHEAPMHYSLVAGHEALYTAAEAVVAGHESIYRVYDTVVVAQDHAALYSQRVRKAHDALFGVSDTFRSQHEALYSQVPSVKAQHEALYGPLLTLQAQHEAQYSETVAARAGHEAQYGPLSVIKVPHEAQYGPLSTFKAQHDSQYSISVNVLTGHEAVYYNTVDVRADNDAVYNLATFDKVYTDHTAYYTLIADAVVDVRTDVTITINGSTISVSDLLVGMNEGDPAWRARVRILEHIDYLALSDGDVAVLDVQGEIFNLIVTEKTIRRVAGALTMELVMESSVVSLMSPRAEQTEYRYETDMMAEDIVEDMLGQPVDWQIYNWLVPANRVAIDEATPYEAANIVVESSGAVIEANKDGTLKVRYRYPVEMNRLDQSASITIFDDTTDNLSAKESYEYRSGVNRVRVMQGESTFSDTLEWVPNEDDDTVGTLRAYLSPWRSTYNLVYTGGNAGWGSLGTVQESVTEIVEFTDGVASVQYPVVSVQTVDWISSSLGAVSFDPFSSSLQSGVNVNQGYGLAEITYTSQSDNYHASGQIGSYAQFIIEDEE